MTIALQLERIGMAFGGFRALDDVSLSVSEGEIVGLVGPNGAGKTVLLSCIAGSLRPTSGHVRIYSVDTTGWPPERLARNGVMRTFQIPQPFANMTVLESVLVAALNARPDRNMATAVDAALVALDAVGFEKDP